MIVAEALRKRFGAKIAVADIGFTVPEGQIHGLLGPNGAGKTTTTRILACLLRPDSGRAWVGGLEVTQQPGKVREQIGILTEVPGLYERLSGYEYLDFFGQVHGLAGSRRRARIEELMKLLDVWEIRHQRLRSFSKGMKQKIAIARALIHQPRVLFFDEPTAALDPEAARTVRDHLVSLIQQERSTVLLCTHNLAEAERICNRVSVVQNGRTVAEGTPAELKAEMERAVTITLASMKAEYFELVRSVLGVESPATRNGCIVYATARAEEVNPTVVRALVGAGADVVGVEVETVALEDAYLHVMKRVADETGATRHPA